MSLANPNPTLTRSLALHRSGGSGARLPARGVLLRPDGLDVAHREDVVRLVEHAQPRHRPARHPPRRPARSAWRSELSSCPTLHALAKNAGAGADRSSQTNAQQATTGVRGMWRTRLRTRAAGIQAPNRLLATHSARRCCAPAERAAADWCQPRRVIAAVRRHGRGRRAHPLHSRALGHGQVPAAVGSRLRGLRGANIRWTGCSAVVQHAGPSALRFYARCGRRHLA